MLVGIVGIVTMLVGIVGIVTRLVGTVGIVTMLVGIFGIVTMLVGIVGIVTRLSGIVGIVSRLLAVQPKNPAVLLSEARRRLRMIGAKIPVPHVPLWRTQEQFYRRPASPSVMTTLSRLVLHGPLQSNDTCQHTPSPSFLPLRRDPNRVRYRQWQSSP